jgi:hypothetical protein
MKRILLFATLLSSVCYVEAPHNGGGKAKKKSTHIPVQTTGAAVSYLGALTAKRVLPRVAILTPEQIKSQTKTPYFRTPNNIQFLDTPGTSAAGQTVLTAATKELRSQTAQFLAGMRQSCADFAKTTDPQRTMIATLAATINQRHQDPADEFKFDKGARAEGMNPLDGVAQDIRATLLEVVGNLKSQDDAATALRNILRSDKNKASVFANNSDFARSTLQKIERDIASNEREQALIKEKLAAQATKKAKAAQLKKEIEAAAAAIEAAGKKKKTK